MRPVVFEGGRMDGRHSVFPDRRTHRRIVMFPQADGGGETYQRDPFVGGEVPNPVVYRFAEQEDA